MKILASIGFSVGAAIVFLVVVRRMDRRGHRRRRSAFHGDPGVPYAKSAAGAKPSEGARGAPAPTGGAGKDPGAASAAAPSLKWSPRAVGFGRRAPAEGQMGARGVRAGLEEGAGEVGSERHIVETIVDKVRLLVMVDPQRRLALIDDVEDLLRVLKRGAGGEARRSGSESGSPSGSRVKPTGQRSAGGAGRGGRGA